MEAIRAGIYARISVDKKGDLLGVNRQVPDCKRLCEQRGWAWSEEFIYVDDDRSAYSGAERLNWDRMLADARDGRIRALVAWQADRFIRRMADALTILDLHATRGIELATAGGNYDLSTASGRSAWRQLADRAEFESDLKSERIRAKLRQKAEMGEPQGGGNPAFGWVRPIFDKYGNVINRDEAGIKVVPEEKALLRDAMTRILAGESVRSIAAQWNAQGILSAQGKRWLPATLLNMLRNPRLVGLRRYKGVVIGPGQWEPIFEKSEWDILQSALTRRAPEMNDKSRAAMQARSYLLTNYAYCSLCGAKLSAHPYGSGRPAYHCMRDKGGCGKIARSRNPVDEWVGRQIIERLWHYANRKSLPIPIPMDGEAADEVAQEERKLERQQHELDEMFSAGEVDRERFRKIQKGIDERLQRIYARRTGSRRAWMKVNLLGELRGRSQEEALTLWFDSSFDRKRSVVELAVERIVVKPVGKAASSSFKPEAIEIFWSEWLLR